MINTNFRVADTPGKGGKEKDEIVEGQRGDIKEE